MNDDCNIILINLKVTIMKNVTLNKKDINDMMDITKKYVESRHSLEACFESTNGTTYNPNFSAQIELEALHTAYFSTLSGANSARQRLSTAYEMNQNPEWMMKLEDTVAKYDYNLSLLQVQIDAWKQIKASRPDLELTFFSNKDVFTKHKIKRANDAQKTQAVRESAKSAKVKLDKVEENRMKTLTAPIQSTI